MGRMFVGRSKAASSRRGLLWPEVTRELIVGREGGSRGSSSAMPAKRWVREEAREREMRRGGRPLTGLAVSERGPAVCLVWCVSTWGIVGVLWWNLRRPVSLQL